MMNGIDGMKDRIGNGLASFGEVARHLEEQAPRIHAALEETEEVLVDFFSGDELWLEDEPLRLEPHNGSRRALYVGVAEVDDEMQLAVRETFGPVDEEGTFQPHDHGAVLPLWDFDLRLRIRALDALPRLLELAREAVEEDTRVATRALERSW